MAKSTQQPPPTGVYAALLTPRQPNSTEADRASLLDYLDNITGAGVDGLVLFGSTGEFIHFDIAERARVATLAIRRSRVPVLVNVSHSTLPGALDLAGNALEAGAAGLLLMPPYFYRYTDNQILEFYREFAKEIAGAIPVYLYNLPFFTNPISQDLAQRLFATGAFAGIKDSSGEPAMLDALLECRVNTPFKLFIGHESIYLRGLAAGADGIVSGVAAAVPELLVALNRAVRVSDQDRAARLDVCLQEFVAWIKRFPAAVAIRQAAISRGWKIGRPALPLDELTASELIAFDRWFRAWLQSTSREGCFQK